MTHLKGLFTDHEPLSEAEKVAMSSLRRGGISSVIWVVTERCNLRCAHCYEGDRIPPREISTEEAFGVIDKLYEAGRPLTFISGGEPLLREDIMQILNRLKELGFRVILSTNGTLLDENKAKKLASIGVDNVAIPLYGPREFHDRFTGVSSAHDRVMKAFKVLSELGVSLTVKTVALRGVIKHIDYLLTVADRFGARALYLCDFVPVGRGKLIQNEVLTKEEWRGLLDRFIEEFILRDEHPGLELDLGMHPSAAIYVMKRLEGMGIDVSQAVERMRKRRLSTEGRGFISISPHGDVLLSNYLPIKLGNALRDDLKELLNHPVYKAVGDSSTLKGKCGSCPFKDLCGGSRVKAYVYTGDVLGEDPTCVA